MFDVGSLNELRVPDGTRAEEHDLVTDGPVVVGGQATVEFGVRGASLIAGERVAFGGDIEADGDCRLDMWSHVDGNVLVGEDAYLGERVDIDGELKVAGDLDIGDDVQIADGFEANGWIVIRNPMPTVVFLVVYLSHLLRLGEEDAAERLAQTVDVDDASSDEGDGIVTADGDGTEAGDDAKAEDRTDGDDGANGDEPTDADDVEDGDETTDSGGEASPSPLVVPRGALVSDDAWRIGGPASVGDDCRLHGNLRATTIEVGAETEIFGSLRARQDITVGPDTIVHGDVTTRDGEVRIAPGATIRGDVACDDLDLDDAAVDGAIRARGEVTMGPDPA